MRFDEEETESPPEVSAQEWRQLRFALGDRLRSLKEALAETKNPAEQIQLQKRIDEIGEQVKRLRLEEAVAQFVEDSERYVVSASMPDLDLDLDLDEELEKELRRGM